MRRTLSALLIRLAQKLDPMMGAENRDIENIEFIDRLEREALEDHNRQVARSLHKTPLRAVQ